MPFRFGSFRLLSQLEMYETPLTESSTVHTVGFRHLETRPVVSVFRYSKIKTQSSVGLKLAFANTHARAGRHARECFPYHSRTEEWRHTLYAYNFYYNKNCTHRGSISFRIKIPRWSVPQIAVPGSSNWNRKRIKEEKIMQILCREWTISINYPIKI